MRRRTDFAVHVTVHARERARERCPGFKAARIVDEVHEAFLDGRLSTSLPLWCRPSPSGYNGHIALYVWSLDQRRVYPLKLDTDAQGEAFIVVTTLPGQA